MSLRPLLSLVAFLLVVAPLSAQPRVEEERPLARALRDATSRMEAGDLPQTISILQQAIDSVGPGEPIVDPLVALARSNFAMQRYPAALATARRILAEYPRDRRRTDILYLYGIALLQGDENQLADSIFAVVEQDDAGRRHLASYWRARIAAERGELDRADSLLEEAFEGDLGDLQSHPEYLRAWLAESRGEIDRAAELYSPLARRSVAGERPDDLAVDAQLRLGVIDARRGNYESSARLLNSITPGSRRQREEQTFFLGEVSAALGRHDEALRYYTAYVREFGGGERERVARYGIGWSQLMLERYDAAITTFRQLEAGVDSISAASSYQIGAIQLRTGDTAAALASFHDLLYRLPYESFSDNANFQLGRIHYRRQNFDSARHYFLVTARQFPESDVRAEAYYLLGESYAALNDAGNAALALGRTRRVGADGELYRRALLREGIMLYRAGRFNSAVDRFREYVAEHQEGVDVAEATFWLGEALYQDRAYAEAERYYGSYLELAPTGSWREQAQYGLAWSRLQQRDFEQAALAFESFVRTNPKSDLAVEATLRLADAYRLMRRYDKAIEVYESIEKNAGKGPRAEEARMRTAEVFLRLGQIDRAIGVFRRLIADYPRSPIVDVYAFNIGTIYREQEMDSVAIEELQRFLATYPTSQLVPQALFTIGDAHYNQGLFDSALVYYQRVLDEHPSSAIVPEALDAVRYTLTALDRAGEALAVVEEFERKNPDRLPADSLAFRKGVIVQESGDIAAAIERYRMLIAEYPESPLVAQAWYQIGRAHEINGADDSALVAYREVARRFPQSSFAQDALLEGASISLRRGAWQQASVDLLQYVERNPESERLQEARFGLGEAALGMGDTAGAFAYYEDVITLGDAGDEDLFVDLSRLRLARLARERGERDDALELLAAVVARRRDELAAEALLLRGTMLMEANDLSGALAELRRLVAEFDPYPEHHEPGMMQLGLLYEQLTNFDAARQIYDDLLHRTEEPALRSQAQERLRRLKR